MMRLARRRTLGGLAVVYHEIGDASGSRERELVPAHGAELFEAQLAHLAERYRIVPASRLWEAAAARRRGDPVPLAVTFDDDLPSHTRVAAPILARRGVGAAFFLNGASLEHPHEFWWQRLQRAVDSGGAGEELTSAVLGSAPAEPGDRPLVKVLARGIQGMGPHDRDALEPLLERAAGPPPRETGMRAEEVRELGLAGFEIGFHTVRHDVLPALDDPELALALRTGRDELERLAGRPLTLVSYPHGRGDARVADAARQAGYTAGFTGRPERVGAGGDPLLMGRIEPSYESVEELEGELERALRRAPWNGDPE